MLGRDPERELLVTRSGRYTYAEIDRLADRAAHALASLGVQPGDRVAGSLTNDTAVVIAFHGAMRLGAVWVGVNRALAPPEKEYLLADSGTTLLLCDEATAEHHTGVGSLHVVVVDEGEEGGEWSDAMKEARRWADEIAANPPLAVAAAKRTMRVGLDSTFEANAHHAMAELRFLMEWVFEIETSAGVRIKDELYAKGALEDATVGDFYERVRDTTS